MTPSHRTIVLGDVHLVSQTPPNVSADLARLIASHPDARIIVAGDLFDLASERPRLALPRAVDAVLGVHRPLRAALARHIDRGGELWLVSGNHDPEVGDPGFVAALLAALDASPEARARVRTTPWFFREGAIHVEHGHLYDPDNAPAHPLVLGHKSLGVHFVEEFIAPTGAHQYLQANDSTPLKLFLASFAWYGPRAPYVIYRYFHAAISAMLRSGPLYRAADEIALGRERAHAFAEQAGVPREVIDQLFERGARPTLESLARTFSRIYFDRVMATVSMATGLGAAALGRRGSGAALFGLGALVMGTSWALGHNRYAGTVPELLAKGASRVAEVTGAKLVVFGHTHREALHEGYANTGSFAFPREAPGRPYLEIEGSAEAPRIVRRYLLAGAEPGDSVDSALSDP